MMLKVLNAIIIPMIICYFGDIYSIQIATMNGADKSLSFFKGRKLLIVTLPSTTTSEDSAYLRSIDSVSKKYSANLSVIAVPSFEDGYTIQKEATLRNFYNALLNQQVTITEGMFTRRSSPSQHALFFWLTHLDENTHFDLDVEGPGQKFFIDGKGELRAVLTSDVKLTRKFIERIIQQ